MQSGWSDGRASGRSKRAVGLALLGAVSLGVAALAPTYARVAEAAPAGGNAAAPPPQLSSLTAMLEGFHWGQTHEDVVTAFNKVGGIIDKDYDIELRKVQPGVAMNALEADRDNKKGAIERSYLQFLYPVGYDTTGLRTEYSYKNNEALLSVDRQGKRRFFFFFGSPPGDRLWKIYDEIPLVDGGPLGKSFAEAVNKMQAAFNVAGRVRAPDPASGLAFTTVDWQDGTTHFRLVDRSNENKVGAVLEERATLNALPQLRSHKDDDLMALDPSIAAITKGGISDPSQAQAQPSASAAPKKKH